MKVVAVKGIEPRGERWEVRYTRLVGRGAKQDAYFICQSLEEAKKKSQELRDILDLHGGVYVSTYARKYARKKATISRSSSRRRGS